jgi:hypothetical protein
MELFVPCLNVNLTLESANIVKHYFTNSYRNQFKSHLNKYNSGQRDDSDFIKKICIGFLLLNEKEKTLKRALESIKNKKIFKEFTAINEETIKIK